MSHRACPLQVNRLQIHFRKLKRTSSFTYAGFITMFSFSLRGIGQLPILSLTTLVSICLIDDMSLELQLIVLPDFEMSTDVLIGMNLINHMNII